MSSLPQLPGGGQCHSAAYVDPLLYAEGFFSGPVEYDQAVRLAAKKVRNGQIQPREPDPDQDE